MRHPHNLFLIGPMGAGKSAVGRQLAKLLHLSFVDSDDEIDYAKLSQPVALVARYRVSIRVLLKRRFW